MVFTLLFKSQMLLTVLTQEAEYRSMVDGFVEGCELYYLQLSITTTRRKERETTEMACYRLQAISSNLELYLLTETTEVHCREPQEFLAATVHQSV